MRVCSIRGLSFFGFLMALSWSTTGWCQTPEEIDAARKRGVDYLLSSQEKDGSWSFKDTTYPVGPTALVGLALMENGIPISDSHIEKANKYINDKIKDLKNTYEISLSLVFLSRVGDRDSRATVRELAARLIAGQNGDGGWGYACPLATIGLLTDPKQKPKTIEGIGDNSCTQFATLALWVASRSGVNIDDAMLKVGERFLDTPRYTGGWTYNHDKMETPDTPTMTFAGMFCLTVAHANRIRAQAEHRIKPPPPPPEKKSKAKTPEAPPGSAAAVVPEKKNTGLNDDPYEFARIETKTLSEDPTWAKGLTRAGEYAPQLVGNPNFYWLWSIERLGVVLAKEKFGETEWFLNGAKSFLAFQKPDGSWDQQWGGPTETAFAILFLRKANLGSDITRLLEGEPASKFVFANRADKPRVDTFEIALAQAQTGDVIRIESNGPFKMPHLDIDKNLTIEAGFGFSPVFTYDIGFTKDKRRSRPEEDPDARHMIRATAGTLTMQGLTLQMDPPEGKPVPYAVVTQGGGNIRILNCTLSEGKKLGICPLRIVGAGKTEVRNSVLIGADRGIDVIASGGKYDVHVDNTVIYSKQAIAIGESDKASGGEVDLKLSRCVLQANDEFYCQRKTANVRITSTGCAYKAEAFGLNLLADAKSHEGLTWTGSDNIYETVKWIGAGGTANTQVKDEKSFSKFWGDTDTNGVKMALTFVNKRPYNNPSHTIRGDDFEFASGGSGLTFYRKKCGIDPSISGPGNGFLRFCDSFEFRNWKAETPMN